MVVPTDLFGEEIQTMDYVLATLGHEENELTAFQVIGITPKGHLKLTTKTDRWARTQLQNTKHCVKITEAQYLNLVK